MSDSPTNSTSDGTATDQSSMFQSHTTAIKAVRSVNWTRTASTAAVVLRGFTH
jgi:hypothetical protein